MRISHFNLQFLWQYSGHLANTVGRTAVWNQMIISNMKTSTQPYIFGDISIINLPTTIYQ